MIGPSKNLAFLSLGSNIRPEIHLPAAVRMLAELGKLREVSRAWQSPPWGYIQQADFVNAAVLLSTPLNAERIIEELIPRVERHLGRQRDPSNKNGPRTIDVDLSLYNREVGQLAGKTIPDPAILERLFVSWPLAELDPDYRHPVDGRTLRQIADQHLVPPIDDFKEVISSESSLSEDHAGAYNAGEYNAGQRNWADGGAKEVSSGSNGSASEHDKLGLRWRADIVLSSLGE